MKKYLLSLFATGALVAMAGAAMAQGTTAATRPVAADQATDPNLAPAQNIAPDSLAAAQPKLKFKIKGVNTEDDGDGEGNDDGGHDDGGQGEGHSESHGDNG